MLSDTCCLKHYTKHQTLSCSDTSSLVKIPACPLPGSAVYWSGFWKHDSSCNTHSSTICFAFVTCRIYRHNKSSSSKCYCGYHSLMHSLSIICEIITTYHLLSKTRFIALHYCTRPLVFLRCDIFQGQSVFPRKSRWSVRSRCLYMCTKCHCTASIT